MFPHGAPDHGLSVQGDEGKSTPRKQGVGASPGKQTGRVLEGFSSWSGPQHMEDLMGAIPSPAERFAEGPPWGGGGQIWHPVSSHSGWRTFSEDLKDTTGT